MRLQDENDRRSKSALNAELLQNLMIAPEDNKLSGKHLRLSRWLCTRSDSLNAHMGTAHVQATRSSSRSKSLCSASLSITGGNT